MGLGSKGVGFRGWFQDLGVSAPSITRKVGYTVGSNCKGVGFTSSEKECFEVSTDMLQQFCQSRWLGWRAATPKIFSVK